MPERSTVYQVVQIGVETVVGTAVPATKKFSTLQASPSFMFETAQYGPSGSKYDSVSILNKEWSEGSLTGPGTFSELIYILAGAYGQSGAPAQIGTTGAYTWLFAPSSESADPFKTFTIERGDSTNAERSAGNVIKSWGYKFDRSTFEVSADFFGKIMSRNITMTATPTKVPLVPMTSPKIDVYFDALSANIGTTRLGRLFSGEFSHQDTKGSVWAVRSDEASWAAPVEIKGKTSFKTVVEADSAGLALIDYIKNSSVGYLRVKVMGDNIGVSADYMFQHDMALQLTSVDPLSDKDGVFSIGLTGTLIDNGGWGNPSKAHALTIVNKQQTL